MSVSNLKDMLIFDEGLKCTAYKCPAGFWTVGVGHNLEANSITTKAAIGIMRDDIENVMEEIEDNEYLSKVFHGLDDVRAIALLNMAFQMGVNGLSKFTNTLEALEDKRWLDAYNHALDSEWYRDDTPARAGRVAQVLLTGTFQAYND